MSTEMKNETATVTIDNFGAVRVCPETPADYVGPSKAFNGPRRDMEQVREHGTVIHMMNPLDGEKVTVTIPADPSKSIRTGGAGASNYIEFSATVETQNA